MGKEKLVLVDGHSILNRAFYGMPDLTNAAGVHTGAVFGFLNILFKILDEEKADYLTVAFDVHAPTFRHEVYKEYKGTRKPMPSELREQVPLIKKVLKSMGVQIREQAGLEADDILGTLARRGEEEGMEVTLVSGDRDLLQIATDHICIRIPKTKQGQTLTENYYAKDVLEKYSVTPKAFIDVKALMGDSSDNIPGVPKVGEKTATQLIVDYGSVDGVYAHLDEIKKPALKKNLAENEDLARLSLFLVTIKTDCDIPADWEDALLGNLYTPEAFKLYTELNFRALLPRFDTAAADTGNETLTYSVIANREEISAYVGELIAAVENAKDSSPVSIGFYPVTGPVSYGEENSLTLYAAALCTNKKAIFIELSEDGSGDGLTQKDFVSLLGKLRKSVREACRKSAAEGEKAEPASLAVFGIKDQYPLCKINTGSLAGHLIADPERTSPDKTSIQKRIFHSGQGHSQNAVRERQQRYVSSCRILRMESNACVKEPYFVVLICKCTFYSPPERHETQIQIGQKMIEATAGRPEYRYLIRSLSKRAHDRSLRIRKVFLRGIDLHINSGPSQLVDPPSHTCTVIITQHNIGHDPRAHTGIEPFIGGNDNVSAEFFNIAGNESGICRPAAYNRYSARHPGNTSLNFSKLAAMSPLYTALPATRTFAPAPVISGILANVTPPSTSIKHSGFFSIAIAFTSAILFVDPGI